MTSIAGVCAALRGYHLLGNEVFDADGATFVRNTACPRRHDANFVTDARCRTAAEVAVLLARVEREFAHCSHRQFHFDPLALPSLAAHLALEGFPFSEQLVMALGGPLAAVPAATDIRPVTEERDWEDYLALETAAWDESRDGRGLPADLQLMREFVASKRAKQPEAQFWLARQGGAAVAYFSSWAAPNGVGVLEDLFTHPAFRHRGIATALLARAVDDVRRRGAGTVALSAFVDDTPKQMYAAMGFEPLYVQRVYKQDRDEG
jgi:GNAT superfamily N-acetyltransferase